MNILLKDLNSEQQRAVEAEGGPVLVLAGAGSGKTRVIAHRIAWLLTERHASPHSLLAVTFTNKAAAEMRQRVLGLLKKDSLPFLWMGTFHGICARMLRADIEALKGPWSRDFTIYDQDDSKSVVRAVMREQGISDQQVTPAGVQSAISRAKSEGLNAVSLANSARDARVGMIAAVFKGYEARLRAANALDFDDLLNLALCVVEEKDDIRLRYQERFHHILVDEYQDTNRIQYRLLRLLSGRWNDIFAVGDEDQSIYSWRGSDIHNILDFQKDFPKAQVIRLERNYRSTSKILAASNALVAHNTKRLGKNLWTEMPGGEPVRMFSAPSDREEAAFVADTLAQLRRTSHAWRQMAVLYRTNAQSRAFEEALLNRSIPYQVVGGLKFYQRKEVKDVLAYIQAALNPLDRVALLRIINVPPRGLGKATLDALSARAREKGASLWDVLSAARESDLPLRARHAVEEFVRLLQAIGTRSSAQSPADLVDWVIKETGMAEYLRAQSEGGPDAQSRIENLQELVSAIREFEVSEQGDLRAFLERQALASDQDSLESGQGADTVKLMTLHAAKGLEFPVVFLAGLEEGFCPHQLSSGSADGIEEERRLCYVGMTRAMEMLYLTWASERYVFGTPQRRTPSSFLREIPMSMVEEVGGLASLPGPSTFAAAAAAFDDIRYTPTEASFHPGSKVHHRKYGLGVVLSVESSGEDEKVTVSFSRFGRKKLLASLAHLEIL